jgi:putative ABC transport system permease protein
VSRVNSFEALVQSSVATREFVMMLLTAFASIAALLALAGVAGVLAYSMSRRKGEMSLRLALGAQPGQLISLSMRFGLVPVLLGLATGLVVAFWLSRLMASLLYGVTSSDPVTYAAVGAALLAAAAVACYLPARRVLDINPAAALRET